MAPPKFADLAKSASDLFKDDFGNKTKVSYKGKTASGAACKVEGSKVGDKVSASFETTFKHKDLSIKEKLTSANVLETEVTADKLIKNAKIVFSNNYNPAKGVSGLKLKVDYKLPKLTFNSAFTTKDADLGACYAHGKYLVGGSAKVGFNGALSGHKLGLAYSEANLKLASTIADASKVEFSVFHAPSPKVDAGVKVNWDAASSASSFAVATKYAVDSNTTVRAKVDTGLNAEFALKQKVSNGVTLGLFAGVNLNTLSADPASVGWTVAFA